MSQTIELPDDLYDRLVGHCEEDESVEELIEELCNIYEETRFVQEGYSE